MTDSATVALSFTPPDPLGGKISEAAIPTLSPGLGTTQAAPARSLERERNFDPLDRRALVAASPAMREVWRQVEQVARTDATVLLLGESGTGKEVIARMIHKLSNRSARKFLKVNCAALPFELLESELFGHEAGAFSGARQARAGKFEICNKGTILLDEIVEMPVGPQAKLLHVLQDGEFARLGSASTIHSDVRVLASTNVDVHKAVRNGMLRADLYYRLNVFTIQMPPLRERKEDLPGLLNHFMTLWAANYARPRLPITSRILEASAGYPWPGNVRELENFVKRYLVLGDDTLALRQLDHRPIPEPVRTTESSKASFRVEPVKQPESCNLKDLVRDLKRNAERTAILQALEQSGGNRQNAANLLRISLRALHYKIRAYLIESASSRGQASSATQSETPASEGAAAGGVGPFPVRDNNKTRSGNTWIPLDPAA